MSYGTFDVTATGNASVSGSTLTNCVKKDPNETAVSVFLNGAAFAGISFKFVGSPDGTNWFPLASEDNSTQLPISGATTISPTDDTETSWTIGNVLNFIYIGINVSAYTSGTATFSNVGGFGQFQPNVIVNSTAGSWTTGAFSGAVTFGGEAGPLSNDGAALGDATHNWSDLFLASGALINVANGNAVITHSSGIFTVSTGDLRVTTAGTNTASVVTVGGTQTLAAKTLTSPVISTGLTASGSAANTFAGSTGTFVTSTGTNTLSGNTIFKAIATPVAATGAGGGVGGAAALGAGNMLYVSSDGATKGVKLLTGVAGDTKWIINTSSTAANLFAASGGTINGGAADAGCAIPASKGVVAFCSAADTWTVFDMPAHAGAAA